MRRYLKRSCYLAAAFCNVLPKTLTGNYVWIIGTDGCA